MQHQDVKDYIHDRLKKVVRDRKLTAKDLIQHTDATPTNCNRIMDDDNYGVTLLSMILISVKLGCSITFTVDGEDGLLAEHTYDGRANVAGMMDIAKEAYARMILGTLEDAELTPYMASKELDVGYMAVTRMVNVPRQVKVETYIDQLGILGYEVNVSFRRDETHLLNPRLSIKEQQSIKNHLREAYAIASKGAESELKSLSKLGTQGESRALVEALRGLLL